MSDRVGIAIIGCGFIGRTFSRIIRDEFPELRLEIICDLDQALADKFKADYGYAQASSDYHQAVSDPRTSAVIVATPPWCHLEVVLAAAQAKKHVLCEKPLAIELADADKMIAACAAADVVLHTGYHCKYAGARLKVKEIIQSRTIGNPVFWREHLPLIKIGQDWLDKYATGGGALFEYSHSLDFACYTFGKPLWVFGQCLNFHFTGEGKAHDSYNVTVKFASGDFFHISGFAILPIAESDLDDAFASVGGGHRLHAENDIVGSKGAIYVGNYKGNKAEIVVTTNPATPAQKVEKYPWYKWCGALENQNSHVPQLKEFLKCIRTGNKEARNDGHQARQTLAVVQAALESTRTEKVIYL